MFIILVAVDTLFSGAIPRLVMEEGLQTTHGTNLSRAELAQVSSTIASHTVLAVLGGVALSLVLVVSGLVNLVTVRLGRLSAWVSSYSWMVLAAAGLLVLWIVFGTTSDLRLFESMVR